MSSIKGLSMNCQRATGWVWVAAAGLACSLAHAGEVQIAVRTYAQDYPAVPAGVEQMDGGRATTPPVASFSALSVAGDSIASAYVEANGLTGTARARFVSVVAADRYLVGRNAFASGGFNMSGEIGIVGPAAPAFATFTAVLEGGYTFSDPNAFESSVHMAYSFLVGASPEFNGSMDWSRTSGLFSIPFTWTQLVQGGDVIAFNLYFNGNAGSVAGTTDFDVLNTFKITGIDLPAGFSYAPDAQGFLSQFAVSAVPEPSTMLMLGIGLFAITALRRRQHRSSSGFE